MKWILIYWLVANGNLFSATGNVLFEDEKSCQGALTAVAKNWPGDALLGALPGVCVAQSTAPIPPPMVLLPPSGAITAVAPKKGP